MRSQSPISPIDSPADLHLEITLPARNCSLFVLCKSALLGLVRYGFYKLSQKGVIGLQAPPLYTELVMLHLFALNLFFWSTTKDGESFLSRKKLIFLNFLLFVNEAIIVLHFALNPSTIIGGLSIIGCFLLMFFATFFGRVLRLGWAALLCLLVLLGFLFVVSLLWDGFNTTLDNDYFKLNSFYFSIALCVLILIEIGANRKPRKLSMLTFSFLPMCEFYDLTATVLRQVLIDLGDSEAYSSIVVPS